MAKVTYFDPAGEQHDIEVENGMSVMEGAFNNMIDGVVAECGGARACATCHVHIDPEWTERVGGPNDMEDEMLEIAENRSERSRLGCQIEITDELDGLVVHIPEGN